MLRHLVASVALIAACGGGTPPLAPEQNAPEPEPEASGGERTDEGAAEANLAATLCERPGRFEVRIAEVHATGGPFEGPEGERHASLAAGLYPPTRVVERAGGCEVFRWDHAQRSVDAGPPAVTVSGLELGEYRFRFRGATAGERLPLGASRLFAASEVAFDVGGAIRRVGVPAQPQDVVVPEAVDPTRPLRIRWTEARGDEVRVVVADGSGTNILCRADDAGSFEVPPAALGHLDRGVPAVVVVVSRVSMGALSPEDGPAACLLVVREERRDLVPFGTEADRARRAASAPECGSDDDCEGDGAACVGLDRRGEIVATPAYRRRCARPCERGACPEGRSCRTRESVDAHGRRTSERLCVPDPVYGGTPAGGQCALDEDCAEAAPFCVSGPGGRVCAAECGDGCPEGTACTRFQLIEEGRIRSVGYCLAPPAAQPAMP